MKKIYLWSILILHTMPFMYQHVEAQNVSVWDGYAAIWTHGSGTETDPYLIETAQNLAWISEMVNNGITTYSGVCFKLTSDLDMNNIAWIPIGNSYTNLFCGKLDGDNHFIDNISITSNYGYNGLFGITGDGFRCENLGVNTKTSSGSYCGGVVGRIMGTNTVLLHCYNAGTLYGLRAGGIVGEINSGSNTLIVSCYNTGNVSSYYYSGGIVGSNEGNLDIYYCYNTGIVQSIPLSSSGTVLYSGGIIGYGRTTIYSCYNSGNIISSDNSGGIAGSISSSNACGYIYNSYNTGTLSGIRCKGIYSDGCCNVINCYYLETCGANMPDGSTPKTEASMKSASFPFLLNSDSIVYVMDGTPNINNGYPIFGNTIYTLTQNADSISFTEATLHGIYMGNVDSVGFDYKDSLSTNYIRVYVPSNNPATYHLNGLQSGITYKYRFFVQKDGITYYGNSNYFTTLACDLQATIIQSAADICVGDSATFTATVSSNLSNHFNYQWSNGDTSTTIRVSDNNTYTVTINDTNGCSTLASASVSINPTYNIPLTHSICQGESYNFYGQNLTTAGTYTHTLQTVNGCDSVLTLTLTVRPLPTPTISGNTTLCQGQSTTLTANGGVSYLWSDASTNNSISVSQSGIYTVTATNAEGCSATANVTVTVNPLPTITVSGNTTLCAGNSTTLTASGADSYSWSTGDNTASVSISAFGVYTVTGTSTAGCSNTANVTVLVSQPPVITISGETDICAGESTTLTANGGETYLWSDGTTTNTLTVGMAGTYQVIGYNAAGCNAMASATVNVWQPATSEFSIECPDSCYTWNGESYCQSGDYTQTLQTVHSCDSVVTLHLTITVGIDNHDLTASMTVYPNPTNGVVNVQFTMNNVRAKTTEIQLYDAYGKLLQVRDGNASQIDLSPFAPGVYFVKAVTNGNMMGVRKVVKQ